MRARVSGAVMLPYWEFWESSAGGASFRSERRGLLDEVVERLQRAGVDVVWSGMVDSPEAGAAAAEEIGAAGAQVLVVAQSMAVPPTYAMAALDRLGDLPVVVWAVQRNRRLGAGFDQSDITTMGATVGTPMLTNLLVRSGRPFELVVGGIRDEPVVEKLARTTGAAAVARSLASARIARVGRPIDGYDCVDIDDEVLRAATGIELIPVDPAEIRTLYLGVSDVSGLEAELASTYEDATEDREGRTRSLRLAAAVEELDRARSFDAGAMNCHVAEIRFGEEPGVTPCFGIGRETTRGVPWTCAGDVLTAVAMLVAKRLGGAALYHEIEAIDFETGEAAIANSGEHDLGWCGDGARPRLQPNPWFRSDPMTGLSAWFELPPGPATLVGFTPHHDEPSGFRLIAAEGEITGRSFPDSPTVGGAFRFAGGQPVGEAWRRWALAGANHHSAAAPGSLANEVGVVARYLGIGFARVSQV